MFKFFDVMKKRIFLFAALAALALISCRQNKTNVPKETIYTVDSLLTITEQHIGDTVALTGLCTHVCQQSGKKLFLTGNDPDKTLRVEASDAIGTFSQDWINQTVQIKGIVKETRIDEAYLQAWEAEEVSVGECSSDKAANGEQPTDGTAQRIAQYRERIAERMAKEGKDYLSFYYIEALEATL